MNDENKVLNKFIPAESIEYADHSVVSKTILKKPTGTVTLFAFDKDEGLSEHTTPHEALIQLLDGAAEIRIGEIQAILKAGECVVMPAGIPHAIRANEKFKMMLTMIRS